MNQEIHQCYMLPKQYDLTIVPESFISKQLSTQNDTLVLFKQNTTCIPLNNTKIKLLQCEFLTMHIYVIFV